MKNLVLPLQTLGMNKKKIIKPTKYFTNCCDFHEFQKNVTFE